jgi:predicted enzyme related to lactoylglutathione lyase
MHIKKSLILLLFTLALSSVLVKNLYAQPMVSDVSENTAFPPDTYGQIVWYTLVTPNLGESAAFYQDIFDWEISTTELKGQKVGLVRYQEQPIASMVEIPGADAALWVASVSTRSVKEIKGKFTANGGRVILQDFNIQNTGKQVILEGPLGEKLGFIENPAHPVSQLTNGAHQWIWTELWSTNTDLSRSFYQKVFNASITENEKTDKPYWFINKGEQKVGGIIPNPAEGARSQWVPYVNIPDIPGFYAGLKETNAKILLGPESGYRNGSIVVFEDPHNALLCIQKL